MANTSSRTLRLLSLLQTHRQADFDLISPPELVDYLRGWADRFLRATAPNQPL
jgi:hypothetical protein